MPTMERSLRHMAWANQQVFAAVQDLPWSAMASHVVDPEWVAGRILYHLVGSASWYAHCLGIEHWQEIPIPGSMDDMRGLAEELARLDALILTAATLDDERLEFEDEDGTSQVMRSTLLAQAAHHASEHRAQLIAALELRGHPTIALDDIDLWVFEGLERGQS